MAASRMIVVVSSSADGRGLVPEVPPGTVVDAGVPVVAGAEVDAGAEVVGGAVVLAVGGTVPAGTDEDAVPPAPLEVAVLGVVSLSCDWPGPCAEAGSGVAAASAAQQIPAVRRRRRIRRHRLTKTRGALSLTTARR
jgi:hypothetical protein